MNSDPRPGEWGFLDPEEDFMGCVLHEFIGDRKYSDPSEAIAHWMELFACGWILIGSGVTDVWAFSRQISPSYPREHHREEGLTYDGN